MPWYSSDAWTRSFSVCCNANFVLKFVRTNEGLLLDKSVLELQKVLSAEEDDSKEGQYMNSLACSRQCNGSELNLSLVQDIFFLMSSWCDSKLQDYHLHFSEVSF